MDCAATEVVEVELGAPEDAAVAAAIAAATAAGLADPLLKEAMPDSQGLVIEGKTKKMKLMCKILLARTVF